MLINCARFADANRRRQEDVMNLTSKQRSYLKGLASTQEALFNVGKGGVSPELVTAVGEALEARELVKVGVLKNCMEDPSEIASVLSERTRSVVVHVIGKKLVLYKPARDKDKAKIKLPL